MGKKSSSRSLVLVDPLVEGAEERKVDLITDLAQKKSVLYSLGLA